MYAVRLYVYVCAAAAGRNTSNEILPVVLMHKAANAFVGDLRQLVVASFFRDQQCVCLYDDRREGLGWGKLFAVNLIKNYMI